MGQTLTHGIYLPDEGERNCYNGLAGNWQLLDGAVGTIAAHTAALAGKAPLVHTHTKADITDFPALANVATSGSYTDLSNIPASFTPASHTHGNITNDGKVGTAANKPLITGMDGVVQAGSFGNQANTFCEGNDSRLSDARTPVAHTHVTADVTDFPDMTLYPYKLAYTTNGGNFPYINLADSGHIALGFNGITDTGIYKVRATADVPGTPNALTLDGILVVFNSDGTANVSSHRRCQQIFYQNSTTPKIFKRIGVFNITSQTWNWDTYKWVEYANTGRDFIPNETDSLNLGSSSYQWNNLYAKNYYYNETAWGLDKSNEWTGTNTFKTTVTYEGNFACYWKRANLTVGTLPSITMYYGSTRYADSAGTTIVLNRGLVDTSGKNYFRQYTYAFSDTSKFCSMGSGIDADGSNSYFAFNAESVIPTTNNATDLGTSTNKWKTLNGCNPGALSLPDMSATGVDISGSIIPPSGETTINISGGTNTYISTINGWLCIVKASSACRYIKTTVNSRLGQTTIVSGSISGAIYHCQPVSAGQIVSILLDADSQAGYYFYPCLGNV